MRILDRLETIKNIILLVVALLGTALLIYSIFFVHPNVQRQESSAAVQAPELFGLYDVVRTVDGDTIVLDIDGNEKTVRLIGVDAPESVHPDPTRNTDDGKAASEWMSEYLSGKQVYIEYGMDPTDDYGRTLAYVYMDDGSTMIQEELLRAGYAATMKIQPNTKYAVRFDKDEQEAQSNQVGLWKGGT